jgi:hypothetical protein
MAFTGNQHTRFLIASRFLESFCQRYSLPASISSANHFYIIIDLPENVNLSSSMLSEWSDIIGKYKKFYYNIKIVNNHYQIKVD